MSLEEATQFAEEENMDFIETSALTAFGVERMFRRVFLSVARLLPEVSFHLDLTELPDGWLSQSSVEVVSGTHSRNNSFSNNTPRQSIDRGARRKSVNISSLNISSQRADSTADSIEYADSLVSSITSGRDQSHSDPSMDHRQVDVYNTTFTNYWTGETQDTKPTHAAEPGLLYQVKSSLESSNDDSSASTKPITRSSTLSTNDRSSLSGGIHGGTDDGLEIGNESGRNSDSKEKKRSTSSCLSGLCNIT